MSDQVQTDVKEEAGTSPAAEEKRVGLRERLKAEQAKRDAAEAKEAEKPAEKAIEEPQIDYKAELEKVRASLEREKTTRQYEREARKRAEAKVRALAEREEGEEDEKDDAQNSSAIHEIVEKTIEERFHAFQRDQQAATINRILSEMTDNEDERELIRLNYEKRINPSGFDAISIENDLKNAYFMANRARFEAQAFEKAQAKAKKDLATAHALKVSASVGAEGREPPESQARPLTEHEEKYLNAMGKGAKERYLNRLKQA
jgi:hypothetical protein